MSDKPAFSPSQLAAEEWRAVPGYEGLYDVSSIGRVRSLSFRNRYANLPSVRILSASKHKGYLSVQLCRGGVATRHGIHVLVLLAFVGPPPAGCECAHGNGVRDDNFLSNLRWASVSENAADRALHGTDIIGENNKQAKLKVADVVRLRALRAEGATQCDLARHFGISQSQVERIVNRHQWKNVP